MSRFPAVWPTAVSHLYATSPDHPVLYFAPSVLQETARRFMIGFPGLVTFAVKANDERAVLENLAAAGMTAFDVASPDEMVKVRAVRPDATLHYNNPVRSKREIAFARDMGVASWSVDDMGELEKIAALVPAEGIEISVRLKLPVKGAAYDFGAKFGASPERCAVLLARVAELGFIPSMTFHPGTQCEDPNAWTTYIAEAAAAARAAGVTLARLNVGGGFPSHRAGSAPDLERIFHLIATSVQEAFGAAAPALVCEPGRAMVAEAFSLCCRVKSLREDGSVFLNDGIYGGLAEAVILGSVDRIRVLDSRGHDRTGARMPRVVFGPTCDSLDRLPGEVPLPASMEEDDFILFAGMGAYSTATNTRFNGYGAFDIVTIGSAG
jgi:ornithine decarboxylase